jgi:uncharacterized membrane protein
LTIVPGQERQDRVFRLNRLSRETPCVDRQAPIAEKGERIMTIWPGATTGSTEMTGLRSMLVARGKRIRAIGLIPRALVFAFVPLLFGTGIAQADFRVCNATQNLVGVAIGYRATAGWVTEGWWHVEGSTCKTLIEGPLSSRYYYLYAEDAERGGRWDGPVNMCVAEREFKIAGVNDCLARGFQRSGFQEYDTGGQSNWMVQLTDDPAADNPAAITGTPQP